MHKGMKSSSVLSGLSVALITIIIWGTIAMAAGSSSSTAESTNEDEESTCTKKAEPVVMQERICDNGSSLIHYHFASTLSTQDEARRIVSSPDLQERLRATKTVEGVTSFCVTATEQSNGRGTSGRQWMGQPGNVFVTIGIPMEAWTQWKNPPVPLTLLPIKVGAVVATQVQELLQACMLTNSKQQEGLDVETPPSVAVKWPNDVLVNERKISGILIEAESGWFLIGIGLNLAHSPLIPSTGDNYGRPSTSLRDWCPPGPNKEESSKAEQVGVALAKELHSFINQAQQPSPETILLEWKQWVDWDMELVLRDTADRERVVMKDVLPDGRVVVAGTRDGIKRTLVSDYFF